MVRFDLATHVCTVLAPTDPDTWAVLEYTDFAAGPYRIALQSADFDVPAELDATNEVVFDGFGQPDSSGSVVIAAGQRTQTVVVDRVTGEASVQ